MNRLIGWLLESIRFESINRDSPISDGYTRLRKRIKLTKKNIHNSRINERLISIDQNICESHQDEKLHDELIALTTRCTRGVRVVFSVTRMRSNNSARINKSDFTTEKIV